MHNTYRLPVGTPSVSAECERDRVTQKPVEERSPGANGAERGLPGRRQVDGRPLLGVPVKVTPAGAGNPPRDE